MVAAHGLLVHPLVQPRPLEPPAISQLEGRHHSFRRILVERVGTDAEIIRSLADVHDLAKNIDARRWLSHSITSLWELPRHAKEASPLCLYRVCIHDFKQISRLHRNLRRPSRRPGSAAARHPASPFRLKAGGELEQIVAHRAGFGDRILERDVGDLRSPEHNQTSKGALVNQVDCG